METISDDALVIISPDRGALALSIPDDRALAFFSRPGAVDPVLAAIRKEIDEFSGDADTDKGRKAIKSMAFKITQSKTYIEGVGKVVAADLKEIPKKVDAARKLMRDTLDAWAAEVRKPVTEWEELEAERVARHRKAIERLHQSGQEPSDCLAIHLMAALAVVKETIIGPHMDEFEAEYAGAKDGAMARLTAAIAAAEKREAEAAELARLRKEAAERDAKEREERIVREAVERERVEGERRAQADIERREAAAKAEREAIEAKAQAEREAAGRRDAEAAKRAEEAERRAAETEARVKREADEARAKEQREAEAREADKKHRAKINNAAAAAFVAGGQSEAAAKAAVTLIAQRSIPAVSISY